MVSPAMERWRVGPRPLPPWGSHDPSSPGLYPRTRSTVVPTTTKSATTNPVAAAAETLAALRAEHAALDPMQTKAEVRREQIGNREQGELAAALDAAALADGDSTGSNRVAEL